MPEAVYRKYRKFSKALWAGVGLLLFPLLFGCTLDPGKSQSTVPDQGKVKLYLQPLSQKAVPLRFTLEGVSAVTPEGNHFPLSSEAQQIKGARLVGEQKLLVSASVPAGSYKGISFAIREAFLLGEDGEAALLVPEEPVFIPHEFELRSRSGLTLFLSLDVPDSLRDGYLFSPALNVQTPRRELVELMGYITNPAADVVDVFHKKEMEMVQTITTGKEGLKGIVLDPREDRGYIAASDSDSIEVFDLLKAEVIWSIDLHPGDRPLHMDLTPDGRTLVCANFGSRTVSIIDSRSLFERNRVTVGEGPSFVAIDNAGRRAYIVNSLSHSISVLDIPQARVIGTVRLETTPVQLAVTRDDERILVTGTTPSLTVIDPMSLTRERKVFLGGPAVSITQDPRTGLIYVGMKTGNRVAIVDPLSLADIGSINVAGLASYLDFDEEENALLVLVPGRKVLQKVSIAGERVIDQIPVSGEAFAIVVFNEP